MKRAICMLVLAVLCVCFVWSQEEEEEELFWTTELLAEKDKQKCFDYVLERVDASCFWFDYYTHTVKQYTRERFIKEYPDYDFIQAIPEYCVLALSKGTSKLTILIVKAKTVDVVVFQSNEIGVHTIPKGSVKLDMFKKEEFKKWFRSLL